MLKLYCYLKILSEILFRGNIKMYQGREKFIVTEIKPQCPKAVAWTKAEISWLRINSTVPRVG